MAIKQTFFIQHKGSVIDKGIFKHVMALSLNPVDHKQGVVRIVKSRVGDLQVLGYIDRSELYLVESIDGLTKFRVTQPLIISKSKELINDLLDDKHDFIGFEDPNLIFDQEKKTLHLYFTIPFLGKDESVRSQIFLGHAQGPNLSSLEMTQPVVSIEETENGETNAKELSFAPKNSQGVHFHLIESKDKCGRVHHSTVRIAKADDFGGNWKLGETLLHPKDLGYDWCAGHVSPGPLLPKEFLGLGENKLLGFLNGREASTVVGEKINYGMFSVGLFVYDYENGKIDWISSKPLIRDTQAKTITFASQFIKVNQDEGILYAHIDDSLIRAYTLNAKQLKELIYKL